METYQGSYQEAGPGGAAKLVRVVIVQYHATFGQLVNGRSLDFVVVAIEPEPIPPKICVTRFAHPSHQLASRNTGEQELDRVNEPTAAGLQNM